MGDGAADIPNADMSLREQFAQYAYGKTIAAVMTNPAHDPSEIAAAAGRANMDIVFGEEHAVVWETMEQIQKVLESAPAGHYKGVALEIPTELQVLLTPEALKALSQEDFVAAASIAYEHSVQVAARNMLEYGTIGPSQYDTIMKNKLAESLADTGIFEPIYQMAQTALLKGTPVYAADANVDRGAAMFLYMTGDMSTDDFKRILKEGMDDRSDVDWLADRGVDLSSAGSLIVHRGYNHINGTAGGVLGAAGFDDLLEAKGRSVVTIAVVEDNGYVSSQPLPPDPANFTIKVDDDYNLKLDRGGYEDKPQSVQPPAP